MEWVIAAFALVCSMDVLWCVLRGKSWQRTVAAALPAYIAWFALAGLVVGLP